MHQKKKKKKNSNRKKKGGLRVSKFPGETRVGHHESHPKGDAIGVKNLLKKAGWLKTAPNRRKSSKGKQS